jgi:hypothetical protein
MADPRPVGYYPDGYVALMPDGSRVLLAYPPGMPPPVVSGTRSKNRKNRKGSRRANRRANRTNRKNRKSSRKNRTGSRRANRRANRK